MKKMIALLLCCALIVCLLAACGTDETVPDTTRAEESVSEVTELTPSDIETEAHEEHEHTHVNYKGLVTADYTLDDVIAAEGREPDFSFDAGGTTFYAYNNVTLNDLTFTQVQFSFSETGNRISCTYSGEEDQAAVLDRFRASMTAIYGEPSASGSTSSWYDGHTSNYVMLTTLNETTVQLAFYIREGA
ncbi:MAG: hypothetical protein CW335_05805 [Clostridiales bacterium]|nr:hypothetical protein [Clostridiales bacterium]